MKNILFLTVAFLFFLASCKEETPQDVAQTPAPHTDNIEISAAQISQMGIKLGDVQSKTISTEVKATGTLHLPPQNRALVSSMMAGKITKIFIHEGEMVNKGQMLATIADPLFLVLQKDFLMLQEELVLKKAELERQEKLKQGEATSEKNFQIAQSAYKTTLAQYEGLKAQLNLLNIPSDKLTADKITSEIPILAPLSGSVYAITANLGEYVQPNKILFEVLNQEHLHIEILVYEKDISHVKEGQKIYFTTNDPNIPKQSATVYAIAKTVELASKTVKVHAEIDGKNTSLLPGMFAEVFIATAEMQKNILPENAVIREGESCFVYHKVGETKGNLLFEKLKINVLAFKNQFAILDSISAKENLVIEGAYYLNATAVKAEEGGDEHAGHSH